MLTNYKVCHSTLTLKYTVHYGTHFSYFEVRSNIVSNILISGSLPLSFFHSVRWTPLLKPDSAGGFFTECLLIAFCLIAVAFSVLL